MMTAIQQFIKENNDLLVTIFLIAPIFVLSSVHGSDGFVVSSILSGSIAWAVFRDATIEPQTGEQVHWLRIGSIRTAIYALAIIGPFLLSILEWDRKFLLLYSITLLSAGDVWYSGKPQVIAHRRSQIIEKEAKARAEADANLVATDQANSNPQGPSAVAQQIAEELIRKP